MLILDFFNLKTLKALNSSIVHLTLLENVLKCHILWKFSLHKKLEFTNLSYPRCIHLKEKCIFWSKNVFFGSKKMLILVLFSTVSIEIFCQQTIFEKFYG